jgi:uncharacterized protein (TIGR02145 family)
MYRTSAHLHRVLLAASLVLCSCGARQHHPSSPTVNKEAKIGDAVWMTENLDVDHYQNGEPIEEAIDYKALNACYEQGKGCWISYLKGRDASLINDANPEAYGTWYNLYAVRDERGLCPKGWHVPTDADWNALIAALGPQSARKAQTTNGWVKGGTFGAKGGGTNESGFSALPAGHMYSDWSQDHGYGAFWWSATEGASSFEAKLFSIQPSRSDEIIPARGNYNEPADVHYNEASSVRCVKNK